jgi:hypothetical protein
MVGYALAKIDVWQTRHASGNYVLGTSNGMENVDPNKFK